MYQFLYYLLLLLLLDGPSPLTQKKIQAHIVPAIKGFFRSISLSPSFSLQDTLRLLTLWFKHGALKEVEQALADGFSTVSMDTWLQVIPQVSLVHCVIGVVMCMYWGVCVWWCVCGVCCPRWEWAKKTNKTGWLLTIVFFLFFFCFSALSSHSRTDHCPHSRTDCSCSSSHSRVAQHYRQSTSSSSRVSSDSSFKGNLALRFFWLLLLLLLLLLFLLNVIFFVFLLISSSLLSLPPPCFLSSLPPSSSLLPHTHTVSKPRSCVLCADYHGQNAQAQCTSRGTSFAC